MLCIDTSIVGHIIMVCCVFGICKMQLKIQKADAKQNR